MGALPLPDLPPGAHRDLVDALHDLHHRAGWPSLRALAAEAGCSHTTVSHAFSAPRLPSWGTLEVLVEAMHGDTAQFHELWLAASTPTNGSGPPSPRIAGRRTELAAVRRHLETGTGLLLVTGEAGIGKTKLVTTAAEQANCFVAVGHCLPLSTEVPLMPIIDVLRRIHGQDDGQWLKEALSDCPSYVSVAIGGILPELVDEGAVVGVAELAREHLPAALGRCLSKLRELRPLGVVLDDLQWADAATLDLVEQLMTGTAAISIVATWRTEDVTVPDVRTAWLARVQRVVAGACDLTPLSWDETIEQLRLRADDPVDRDLAHRIHDRSQGHPLFTEHLAAHAGAPGGLPRVLADLLGHRLEDLGDDAVTVTAVLGLADRGLSNDLLAEVTGLEHTRLVTALNVLASRHLLTPDDPPALGHPLLAEAARRRVVPGEAPRVHRRLAEALGARPAASAAEVAEHWRAAEEPRQELRWRVDAAQQAHERMAPDVEAQQWLRALEIHALLPESDLDEAAARVAAFDAFELCGQLDTAGDVVRQALPAIEDLDDSAAAEVLRRVGMAEDWLSDDPGLGLSLVDRAITRLAPHGASEGLVNALDVRANQLMDLGLHEEALAAMEEALELSDALGDDSLYFGVSATLAWHHAQLGDLDEALRIFAEARARVPGSAGPRREAYMAMMHTDALIQHRRPAEEVMAAAARAIEVGREWDMDFHLLTIARANVVEALFKTGRVREAAEALAALPTSNKYDHWPVSWMSALVAIAQGRPAEGLGIVQRLDITGTGSMNVMHRARWIAVAELWLGRPEDAWAGIVPALDAVVDQPVIAEACLAFLVAARAGAEVARSTRSSSDRVRRTLLGLRERAVIDPLGPGSAPVVRAAATAQWAAELARIDDRDTVEQWSIAATEWDGLRSPHDAAYCRWRAAQAAFREGHGTVAARLLSRAAGDAREHVPLLTAIRATASSRPPLPIPGGREES